MRFITYIGEEEIQVSVEYSFTPELPAKINCLPEDAHPAEAAEIEIESVVVSGFDYYPLLSTEVKEQIEEQALEHAVNSAIDAAEQKADYDRNQEQF